MDITNHPGITEHMRKLRMTTNTALQEYYTLFAETDSSDLREFRRRGAVGGGPTTDDWCIKMGELTLEVNRLTIAVGTLAIRLKELEKLSQQE